jgi:hypothetical protein
MKIEFLASLPPIQSAIKIDGSDGNASLFTEEIEGYN